MNSSEPVKQSDEMLNFQSTHGHCIITNFFSLNKVLERYKHSQKNLSYWHAYRNHLEIVKTALIYQENVIIYIQIYIVFFKYQQPLMMAILLEWFSSVIREWGIITQDYQQRAEWNICVFLHGVLDLGILYFSPFSPLLSNLYIKSPGMAVQRFAIQVL